MEIIELYPDERPRRFLDMVTLGGRIADDDDPVLAGLIAERKDKQYREVLWKNRGNGAVIYFR